MPPILPTGAARPSPRLSQGLSRRSTLLLAGAAAAVAGAGLAWRRLGPQPSPTGAPPTALPQTATSGTQTAAAAVPADFWQQHFDRPEGGQLALSSLQGHPVLVNFWATWCPPCVKELPELDRFHREFGPRGWQVIGLAIDGPTPVKEFLAKVRVGFAIGLAGFGGTELAQALGNDVGGLPFSVLISKDGRIVQRKMGATNFDELAAWAGEMAG